MHAQYLEVSAGGVNLVKDLVGTLGAYAVPVTKQGFAGQAKQGYLIRRPGVEAITAHDGSACGVCSQQLHCSAGV